jgi:hypothetical protein
VIHNLDIHNADDLAADMKETETRLNKRKRNENKWDLWMVCKLQVGNVGGGL